MLSEKGTDIIFGLHAVTEALEAGKVNKLYIDDKIRGKNADFIKSLAADKRVSISWTPKAELSKLAENGVHQGFAARVAAFAYQELGEFLSNLAEKPQVTVLVLDELTDPHNLGSIARTAVATGVDGLIIPKHHAVGITPTAVKASTGALEHIPVVRVTNLSQTLDALKKAGFWIFGTDMAGTDYRKWQLTAKTALIIGSEGRGISKGLKNQVDEMLTIPMEKKVQSLNASVAASLLMYEVFRKREENF